MNGKYRTDETNNFVFEQLKKLYDVPTCSVSVYLSLLYSNRLRIREYQLQLHKPHKCFRKIRTIMRYKHI